MDGSHLSHNNVEKLTSVPQFQWNQLFTDDDPYPGISYRDFLARTLESNNPTQCDIFTGFFAYLQERFSEIPIGPLQITGKSWDELLNEINLNERWNDRLLIKNFSCPKRICTKCFFYRLYFIGRPIADRVWSCQGNKNLYDFLRRIAAPQGPPLHFFASYRDFTPNGYLGMLADIASYGRKNIDGSKILHAVFARVRNGILSTLCVPTKLTTEKTIEREYVRLAALRFSVKGTETTCFIDARLLRWRDAIWRWDCVHETCENFRQWLRPFADCFFAYISPDKQRLLDTSADDIERSARTNEDTALAKSMAENNRRERLWNAASIMLTHELLAALNANPDLIHRVKELNWKAFVQNRPLKKRYNKAYLGIDDLTHDVVILSSHPKTQDCMLSKAGSLD